MTTLPGNANTLTHDAVEARKNLFFSRNRDAGPALPPAAASTKTRLLGVRRWPGLTVELFEEPAYVTPVVLAPPRHLRLLLLLSGTMRMRLLSGGKQLTYNSAPGTVKLTTPYHLPYEMQWATLTAEPIRTAHVYLPNELLAQTAEAAGLNAARVELTEGSCIADPLLYQLGHALAGEVTNSAAQNGLYVEAALQMLAAQLLRQHCVFTHHLPDPRGKLSAAALRRVRDYVRAHLAEPVRLEELAALTHTSPHYFCRLFKRSTGLSPHQFVMRQRLEQATELLRHSRLNVSEVAAAVGYASQSHFSHVFRRSTGRLPTDFIREHRG